MIDNANKDELIEQYLRGDLNGVMLNEFKEKLSTDEQFKKEVALQKAIIRNIKAVGREKWGARLVNIHNEMNTGDAVEEEATPKITNVKRIPPFYNKKYILAAAATIILIICSAIFMTLSNRPGTAGIFISYFKPHPLLEENTRGVPSGEAGEKQAAFNAYNEGNYVESIRLFNNLLAKGDDEIILFYLGNAYLSADKPADAENAFKKYLARYREYAPESKWYLSLCYLKQGKTDLSRKLLEEMTRENNDYSKKAEEILSKL